MTGELGKNPEGIVGQGSGPAGENSLTTQPTESVSTGPQDHCHHIRKKTVVLDTEFRTLLDEGCADKTIRPKGKANGVEDEYRAFLEGFSSSQNSGERNSDAKENHTAQVEDEYQALLNTIVGEKNETIDSAVSTTIGGQDSTAVDKNDEIVQGQIFSCWTPVSILELSHRTMNTLTRMEIDTIRTLVQRYDSIDRWPRTGLQTQSDIQGALIKHSEVFSATSDERQTTALSIVSESKEFVFDIFGRLRRLNHRASIPIAFSVSTTPNTLTNNQLPISFLHLSNRLFNSLSGMGYKTIGEVSKLTEDELLSIRGVGLRGVIDLKHALKSLEAESNQTDTISGHQSLTDEQTARQGVKLALGICMNRSYPIFREAFMATMPYAALQIAGPAHTAEEYRDAVIRSIEGTDQLVKACEDALLERIELLRVSGQTTADQRGIAVPNTPEWNTAAQKVEATTNGCVYDAERHEIAIRPLRLIEWLEASSIDERTLLLLRMYLNGQTLNACGQRFGLTRERVRQIVSKRLAEAPSVEEDCYRYFYKTYGPSKESFLAITHEPISTFVYLRATRDDEGTPTMPLSEALDDDQIPLNMRDEIRKMMDRDYIYDDGCRVKSRRDAIINHVVMRHASHRLITVKELRNLYLQFLNNHELSDNKNLRFGNLRAFEAYVERCDCVMKLPHAVESKLGGSIRYYDASTMDFEPLVQVLSSGILGDVECSAEMLMHREDLADILEVLDIHNGYELHYVLSRYCADTEGMLIRRSPNIVFGDGDRGDQIVELIKELSPVSATDLAKAYTKRYGVDVATFVGSYLTPFKIYYKNGKYVYSNQSLSQKQADFIKSQLYSIDRDYLPISVLKARFKDRFPTSSTSLMNEKNLASFGFHPSADLLVRDGVDERALFSELIDSHERFAISDDGFGKAVFDNPAFMAELRIRMRAFKVVEYKKGCYIATSVLTSKYVNLNEADLKNFVDRAIDFMLPDTPYTVRSLVAEGFSHKTDILREDPDLGDFFFASLLETGYVGGRLKGTSVANTPVFCKSQNGYSAPILMEQIVAKEGAMSIDGLAHLLQNRYDIHANNALLRVIAKRSNLSFNEIDDMVFDPRAGNS